MLPTWLKQTLLFVISTPMFPVCLEQNVIDDLTRSIQHVTVNSIYIFLSAVAVIGLACFLIFKYEKAHPEELLTARFLVDR